MPTIVRLIAAIAALSESISRPVSAAPFDGDPISGPDIAARAVPPNPATSPTNSVPGKPNTFAGSLLTGSVINGQTTLTAGAPVPTGVYNPNGPVFNPNDYASSLPFIWPGKPSAVGQAPPPRPTTAPFQPGGSNASQYHSPAWIPSRSQGLTPSLGQSATNGNSTWGLLPCPTFPPWLGGSPPNLLCTDQPPLTGITRYYDFTVAYQKIAPDGVVKNGITINGQFPGPLIEANWGDWIEVKVTNQLTDEGTSIHWHGILQKGTPWYDGVPSVSQCPIAPGQSFTYRFRADLYGSSWYHSHYSAQYAGGAVGPMIIHGPILSASEIYDVDLGPIMLNDWYHQDYYTLVNGTMHGAVPASNNNLINGKMNYPCGSTTLACTPNAGISKFQFQSGKKYRLRLINTSAEGIQKFSIDSHNFTVIANDFVPVKPYTTNMITLGVAQRTDVIVEATGQSGQSYWMRSNLGAGRGGCSFTDGISTEAVAAVYYQNANTSSLPTTTSGLTSGQLNDCGNDPLSETVAFCPITPDPNPPTTDTIEITFGSNGTAFIWFMNNSSFRGDYNDPVLLDAKAGNVTFPSEYNVLNFGNSSSVRVIVKNTFQFGAHPLHLHGHNYHVLAEGFGEWDGTVQNANNTQRRDVQLVRAAKDANTPAYVVLQWTQDNPAAWPFHCHIAWHVSAGLYVQFLEQAAEIQRLQFPSAAADLCQSWDAWTNGNVPDQIDSGL